MKKKNSQPTIWWPAILLVIVILVFIETSIRIEDVKFQNNVKDELFSLMKESVIDGYQIKKDRSNAASFKYQVEVYQQKNTSKVILSRTFGDSTKINFEF